tara:strand:+ start:4114 stop:4425 length:312 start_codon:yes stop_codon:yes gene_type:complete
MKKKNKIIEKELRKSDYIKFTKRETSDEQKVELRTNSISKLVSDVENKLEQKGLSSSELSRLERQVKSLDKFLAIEILSNEQNEKVRELKVKSNKIFKKKPKK